MIYHYTQLMYLNKIFGTHCKVGRTSSQTKEDLLKKGQLRTANILVHTDISLIFLIYPLVNLL